MSELCKEYNVRWTYKNVAYGFCFVFYRNNVQANVHADVHAYNDLTKDEKTIFIKIKENPKTLKNELASIIGKSEKTVHRCLNSLIKKKYISRIGTNQYGYWEILKSFIK